MAHLFIVLFGNRLFCRCNTCARHFAAISVNTTSFDRLSTARTTCWQTAFNGSFMGRRYCGVSASTSRRRSRLRRDAIPRRLQAAAVLCQACCKAQQLRSDLDSCRTARPRVPRPHVAGGLRSNDGVRLAVPTTRNPDASDDRAGVLPPCYRRLKRKSKIWQQRQERTSPPRVARTPSLLARSAHLQRVVRIAFEHPRRLCAVHLHRCNEDAATSKTATLTLWI